MAAIYIWAFGALVITLMGTGHLLMTFFSDKFSSPNERVVSEMKSSHTVFSRELNMWNAWVGFNGSHSSGAMFIGIMNLYMAFSHPVFITSDVFYVAFNIVTLSFYLWLGKRYWFKTPFRGVLIVLLSFVISAIMSFC